MTATNFTKKRLRVTLVKQSSTFAGQNSSNTVTLEGYRMAATIMQAGGYEGHAQMHLRIWGLRDSIMQELYGIATLTTAPPPTAVRLEATSGEDQFETVYEGQAYSIVPDYNSAPDVSVEIQCDACAWTQWQVPAANSGREGDKVADVIQGLARAAGYSFKNYGVTATLPDWNVNGSAINQIIQLAHQTRVVYQISNFTIYIWPNQQTKSLPVIQLGPKTGLVGYPSLIPPASAHIVCVFNNEIDRGRQIQLDTSLKSLSGTWYVAEMSHELSCELPGGPWFTHATLLHDPIDASLHGG